MRWIYLTNSENSNYKIELLCSCNSGRLTQYHIIFSNGHEEDIIFPLYNEKIDSPLIKRECLSCPLILTTYFNNINVIATKILWEKVILKNINFNITLL